MAENNAKEAECGMPAGQASKSQAEPKIWLREKEIIRILSVSRSTLWLWVKNKTFPQPFKIGCCTFWKVKEVMDFVEQNQN